MDWKTFAVVVAAWVVSVAGMIELCLLIDRRHQKEARRELFGLSPGRDPWP